MNKMCTCIFGFCGSYKVTRQWQYLDITAHLFPQHSGST